ncbi:MAG: hypothetical protein H0W72_14095 [Planctomycetes bacterium]|nr:hypothetical protein [Planctomycetota bacterium]
MVSPWHRCTWLIGLTLLCLHAWLGQFHRLEHAQHHDHGCCVPTEAPAKGDQDPDQGCDLCTQLHAHALCMLPEADWKPQIPCADWARTTDVTDGSGPTAVHGVGSARGPPRAA